MKFRKAIAVILLIAMGAAFFTACVAILLYQKQMVDGFTTVSTLVILGVLIAAIYGLMYVIAKLDEEEENEEFRRRLAKIERELRTRR